MRASGKLLLTGLAALLSLLLSASGIPDRAAELQCRRVEPVRMRNVQIKVLPAPAVSPAASPPPVPTPTEAPAPAEEPEEDALSAVWSAGPRADIRETTIGASQLLKNETGYEVDVSALLEEGAGLRLAQEGPQILILHTHGSEAYTPAGLDRYDASDANRTQDARYSVIRVGDELASLLEEQGLEVIHDREIYDYPSYTGSYSRSGEAVERYLEQYPQIGLVIDLHRDALGGDGVVYKTMAEEEGTVASQIMLLVGTDESGLEHPDWRSNLAVALYLQNAATELHPTLMRPVDLVPQRYNQQLSPGALILEVGSSGNTLQEALAAIRLFARAVGPALLALTES